MEHRGLTVTKSNALIEARYKLTLNEQRLVLSAIARLDPRKQTSRDHRRFSITAKEFAESFNVGLSTAYEALQDATKSLYNRDIKTFDGKVRKHFRWVDAIAYIDREARVEINFTDHVMQYLTLLNQQFTKYELQEVAHLNSPYSIRIYEMLIQYRATGWLNITLDKFRERLALENSYSRFDNLKARVINPAITELQQHSNLKIEWKTVKQGRKVIGLLFSFEECEQPDMFKPTATLPEAKAN